MYYDTFWCRIEIALRLCGGNTLQARLCSSSSSIHQMYVATLPAPLHVWHCGG